MTSLDLDTITKLLKEQEKPQPPKKVSNEPKPHEGPLGVLLQSDNCKMCARGDNFRTKNIRAMYTVDGTPLCTPHAMYVLSCICVENGYEVQIEGKVENVNGSGGTKSLPGDL
jgi:hypothetical protein